MLRIRLGIIAAAVLLAGCGLASLLPVTADPACRDHADHGDCQAALDAAKAELRDHLERYSVTVAPIECRDGQCTTWVSAVPAGDDCLPLWDIEVTRPPGGGGWSVSMTTHGDPPCAFEP